VGPVVRRERQDAELGQLAMPDLVRDLARLHVAFRVVPRRLHHPEAAQRTRGELGIAGDRLH